MNNDFLIHAVVFDWAGTTIDFGSISPILALQEAFRLHGLELDLKMARGPMGVQKIEHVRYLLNQPAIVRIFAEKNGRIPMDSDVQAIYASLDQIMDSIVLNRTELIRGHETLVRWLRERGVGIGSTTGYTRETMEKVLAAMNAQGYSPDVCITPSETGKGRPAPWMMWRNMEILQCEEPWRVIKLGDTEVDMQEGRRAGTWCVGYSCSGNMMGLEESEFNRLSEKEVTEFKRIAEDKLYAAGANLVVEGPWQAIDAVIEINASLVSGKRP